MICIQTWSIIALDTPTVKKIDKKNVLTTLPTNQCSGINQAMKWFTWECPVLNIMSTSTYDTYCISLSNKLMFRVFS